ncbi:MAG: cytochrome c1 [Shewanella sp.]
MKKLLIALVALVPTLVFASGSSVHLESANIDLNDTESLQRGLGLFQHNCAGCHSTQYQRYSRVAEDLNISLDEMRDKYMFDESAKLGDLMENSIPEDAAAKWFGATPPDLTLVARVRGEDWIYTYLKGFYKDENRPFGVNNIVFPSVGMPHVLEHLQGVPVKEVVKQQDGTEVTSIVVTGGSLNAEEYDKVVRDITAFLVYSGDPVKLERERLGWWVMGFLFIFFVITYLLKKEYWRDVH